jgi:hypothetical protein
MLTDAEKLNAAKAAISQLPATISMTEITRVATSNVKYEVFKKIKKNVNGVEISVLPMKVSGNALYEQNAFFSLVHGYLQGESTVHVYKNEVNELKYELIDSKVLKKEIFEDKFPMNIRNSAKSFIGKIKTFEKKPTSFEINFGSIEIDNGKKDGSFIGCIPNSVADFVNDKVNIGDVVRVYYYENGPHACNFIYVYEIDKLAKDVIPASGTPAPPIAPPNQ